jgi:hypothetical protein
MDGIGRFREARLYSLSLLAERLLLHVLCTSQCKLQGAQSHKRNQGACTRSSAAMYESISGVGQITMFAQLELLVPLSAQKLYILRTWDVDVACG